MRFLFKYPTKGRPEWFRETLSAYYSKLSGKHEYQFVIAMDNDDAMMNNQPMRQWLNSQEHLTYFYADHANKIHACNTGIPDSAWDILVLISDDMTPVAYDFDDIIAIDMQMQFPELDGVLQYADGVRTDELMTLSIMGRKFYEKYGCVYHPAYKSQWCDNDVTDVAKMWNKFWHSDRIIIRHEWKKHGMDKTYEVSDKDYHSDKAVYDDRKKHGFPLMALSRICRAGI